jgi:asparagine synthase (glutamine-hydrolysing)
LTDAGSVVVGESLPPRLRPRPLEVACGLALGTDDEAQALGIRPSGEPRAAIETAIRRALGRPPCLVSFSGGRDSSAVLAIAAAVARRDDLSLPVPATYRFAAAAGSQEDEWQEQVVRHLGLPDWERISLTSELDAVGPVAQAVLVRHGLLWPFNAHFHAPLLEKAACGSLLTGIGGDELLGPQLWSSARILFSGRHRQRRVRLRSVAAALAPRPVRRRALVGYQQPRWPWLRPEIERAVARTLADWRARTPVAWSGGVGWWWRSRYRTVLSATMAALAADAGAYLVHPFLDGSVVGAMAGHYGRQGPLDRSAAMGELFGDVLPPAVLTRRSKAHFDEAFVSDHSRAFASGWTGAGVDEALVDHDRLAAGWRSEHPDPRSLLLMQAAWLACR